MSRSYGGIISQVVSNAMNMPVVTRTYKCDWDKETAIQQRHRYGYSSRYSYARLGENLQVVLCQLEARGQVVSSLIQSTSLVIHKVRGARSQDVRNVYIITNMDDNTGILSYILEDGDHGVNHRFCGISSHSTITHQGQATPNNNRPSPLRTVFIQYVCHRRSYLRLSPRTLG